jgi:signal transduction histidine kinase
MNIPSIIPIYFFYGLAFFSMGLLVISEGGRSFDARLRRALRPLAVFGLVHAANEWLEMLEAIARLGGSQPPEWLFGIRLMMLAFSFLSLAAFGSYLLAMSRQAWRLSLLVPLGLTAIWVSGLLLLRNQFANPVLWDVADVWTRYTLAIPAALLAAVGLVIQQKVFRKSGLIKFGQDALWAAVAFGWYGLVGQLFGKSTPLPISTIINEGLFQAWFGIPIQLFRAAMAGSAAFFVIRFLRAFQVEIDSHISNLQEARLHEAEQRETLRGELFQQVVSAQEAERQRIARELHDETGQALTALGLGLRGLTTSLHTPDLPRATQLLQQLESLTAHSLTELQRLISDLRPSHLDDLGLPSALRWYANDIGERTSLKIQVEVIGQEREIQAGAKTALFRIVQEALTNVVKHAQASSAKVTLTYTPESVQVAIQDSGSGFDPHMETVSERTSWGLKNMQERTALLGGSFKIRSRPGEGTLVEVSLPDASKKKETPHDDPVASGG